MWPLGVVNPVHTWALFLQAEGQVPSALCSFPPACVEFESTLMRESSLKELCLEREAEEQDQK